MAARVSAGRGIHVGLERAVQPDLAYLTFDLASSIRILS